MKKTVYLALFILVILLVGVVPAQADGHGHGHFYGSVWIGPGWWGPYPYANPYYNGYYSAPPVTQEQAPTYAEPAPRAEERYYWYFCPEARNYYPYVRKCPKGWLKVVPPSAPSDYEE